MPLFNPTAEVQIGSIRMWLTATPPTNYLILNGSAVSRTTYSALFALWGTTFGVGDGSTTFNLPDARQKFPLGTAAAGTGSTLGGTGGAIDHTHAVDIVATASGGPSATVNVSTLLGGTPVGTSSHTHTTNPANTTSTTNNPPFMAYHFIVRAL